MKKEKIVNLVNRNIGSAKKKYAKSDTIKYIDISSIDNIKNKLTGFTEYVFEKAPSRAQQCLIQNDILVSTVRPNLRNIAINDYKDDNYVGSSGFCVLRTNEKCDSHYLYYNLLYNEFTNAMISLTAGAAYPAIKDSDILNYEINVPPLSEQQKIAHHLDTIQSAIDNKKKQLSQLDELVKSKFVEMFGENPVESGKWKVEKWSDKVTITNGRDYKKLIVNEGLYPVYGSGGDMGIRVDEFLCKENTVIIGRKGNIDKPLLVKEKFWNVDTAFGLNVNENELNPIFFFEHSKLYDYRAMDTGVTIPSLTKTALFELKLAVPPIELQNTFAEYVQKIDAAKSIIKTQLVDLKELLDSKMDEYFA